MTKHREDEYEFPCALVRGNERTLLRQSDMIKVIESRQFQQAVNVLGEFGYGDGKELENPRDFEKLLKAEQKRVTELVYSIIPEREEIEFLLYPNDYHNVKVLLKSEFLGISPEPYLVNGGSVPAEKMRQMIKERNLIFLSSAMRQAVTEAIELFSKGRDPQEIDIILDKACYEDMLQAAEQTENCFLIGYVRLLIDLLNISIFIRLRQIHKSWSFFQKVFLEGGSIGEKLFTASYEEAYSQLADKLAPYGFRQLFSDGAAAVRDTGKYTLLERLCDNMRMKYIKDAKYVTAGIEPVAAFYIAKESEIKNLRMVLTGKLAGTSEEIMKERLRETYV